MNRESIKLGLLVFYRENLSIENLESHELSRLLDTTWIKMLEKGVSKLTDLLKT